MALFSNCKLASLDIVSLFINVPHEWVYKSISKRWEFITLNTKITKEEFLKAIKLILNSTYFSFNKIIYKQVFGISIGLSLVIRYLEYCFTGFRANGNFTTANTVTFLFSVC